MNNKNNRLTVRQWLGDNAYRFRKMESLVDSAIKHFSLDEIKDTWIWDLGQEAFDIELMRRVGMRYSNGT